VRVGHEVAPANPQLVTVLLGANDAIYGFPESRERKALSKLIDELLVTTDAEILILGPTPITDKPGVPEAYDALYAKIAAAKRVAYLNLTPALGLLSKDDYKRAFADNVHWSEYGHKVLGKAVADYILELAK
jgi:lysophospholipase L1-like esterase